MPFELCFSPLISPSPAGPMIVYKTDPAEMVFRFPQLHRAVIRGNQATIKDRRHHHALEESRAGNNFPHDCNEYDKVNYWLSEAA